MEENFAYLFMKNRIEDVPISHLELSARAGNMLRMNGITYLRHLCGLDEEELKKLPYSNPLIAREIALCLHEYLHDPGNSRPEPEPEPMQTETNRQPVPEAGEKEDPIGRREQPRDNGLLDPAPEREPMQAETNRQPVQEADPAPERETRQAETKGQTAPERETRQAETAGQPAPKAGAKGTPIERLGLSRRSYNALMRAKLYTIQQLAGKTEEELLNIRNLGRKSAEEIVEAVKAYLAVPHEDEEECEPENTEAAFTESVEPVTEPVPDSRPIEVLLLSKRSYNVLKRAKIDTVQQLMALDEQILGKMRNLGTKSLEELAAIRKAYVPPVSVKAKAEYSAEELKPLLLSAYRQPFHGLSFQEFRDAMPEEAGDGVIKKAVGMLLAEGKLEYVDFRCYRVYPSFYEELNRFLNQIKDRERVILERRYAGETMEAIAQDLEITRERVRQIQDKQFRKLASAYRARTGFPVFAEDFYETLYTRCELPEEFWSEELALPESSINYLKITFRRGMKKPEEILRDEEIPVSLRYRVRSFLDRDKIRIDGKLFARKRSELEQYALQKYTQDEISFERFTELYNGMLEGEGIAFDEKIYYTEEVMRARINGIRESRYCLWKQGSRLRWYDIDARDYTTLTETLNPSSYQNTEVSTLKFMRQYPELMEDYDIRDAYELHNLLKKISKAYGLDFINFSRQPILQFGEFDRQKAIKEAMIALAPVTQEELLEYLYLEYGYDKQTAGSYLTPLSAYYHNGIYSVDFKQIPEQRAEPLRAALKEDFYYTDEIKRLYGRLFPEADPEEINPYSLKSLGFEVYSGYVIRNYPSAAYFTQLLTKEDLYDISPMQRLYGRTNTFNQAFNDLLKAHRIFRFEKDQIISFRRLARLNVSEELLQDYCTAVRDFAEEDSYFTIFSLRQDGFDHALDLLGLSDYFYASLLSTDERFSSSRMFGEIVLYNGSGAQQLSRKDFILTQLQEYDSVEPEEFLQDIRDRFGLNIPDRYEVTGAVRDSELYYDPIMDKIYREKALYYADIDE